MIKSIYEVLMWHIKWKHQKQFATDEDTIRSTHSVYTDRDMPAKWKPVHGTVMLP